MFPAARAVLLSMRASEDFGGAEKLSAAEQIKPDCCRTPAVVSILTDSAACVTVLLRSTTAPLHNDSFSLYIAVSHMAHVLVYYTLLVVIIICIMFVKLRKSWRM